MSFIAYTKNPDDTINILAGSDNPKVFSKILPNQEYEIHEGNTFTANGKTYLTECDNYKKAKTLEENQKALAKLDNDYEDSKNELMKYYNEAGFYNNTVVMAELKEEMSQLNETYEQERLALTS